MAGRIGDIPIPKYFLGLHLRELAGPGYGAAAAWMSVEKWQVYVM